MQQDKLSACAVDAGRGVVYVTGSTWGDFGTPHYKPGTEGSQLMDYYNDFLAMRMDYATGEIVWSYQDQGGKQDEFVTADIEPAFGDLLVAGTTSTPWGCTDATCPYFAESVVTRPDFVAARLALADGQPRWKWQAGTRGSEVTYAASYSAVTGQYVVAGATASNYAKERVGMGLRDTRAYPYDSDMASTTLTAFAKPVAKWQDGTARGDRITAVAHAPTGEVYLAGDTSGAFADDAVASLGANMVVIKQGADGVELWRHQNAGIVDTRITCAATDADGNVYVGGYARLAATEEDFYVAKLDAATGAVLWEYKAGTAESDIIQGIAVDAAGNIAVAGYTAGKFGAVNKGLYDFVVVGLSPLGVQQWAWQDGTDQSDRLNAIASDTDAGTFVVAGDTYGTYTAPNAGSWDLIVMKLTAA
ncbi:hypothetical protein JKP88DRAFT_353448 [Tribonema minus]|uniref:Pyrrolo-quinoline quinone repeat domain-containing protein n=1 Tax=Tribonema minus TaxID=303371 RepID=A0A836CIY2_9STRA|nr:hypothetical protein JKP88DRAFT_353448 [Tribonema minus]